MELLFFALDLFHLCIQRLKIRGVHQLPQLPNHIVKAAPLKREAFQRIR